MGKGKPLPAQSVLESAKAALDGDRDDGHWHRYRCKLVTPMYGGGVEAGKVDEDMPIRATAIRGQLRFWWRIAHRLQFIKDGKLDSQAMFRRERELWGGLGDAETLAASKITILIQDIGKSSFKNSAEQKEPADKYAFGAAANNGDANWLSEGLTWSLAIKSASECWSEAEKALTWWASFGGLGARTRRGFGAVEVVNLNGNTEGILTGVAADEASTSGCRLILAARASNAIAAWRTANEKMRVFRQGPGVGRKTKREGQTNGASPGRSHWPEPDAIRRTVQSWFGRDKKKYHQAKDKSGKWNDVGEAHDHAPMHTAGNVFPRAAFGLPIIFKFKDDKHGEPAASTLVPVGHERMASPIILRPYRAQSGWAPMALVLPLDHVWSMKTVLQQGNRKIIDNMTWWPTSSGQAATTEKIPPMRNRGKDPIAAFLAFFEENSVSATANGLPQAPKPQPVDTKLGGAQIRFYRANGSISLKKDNTEVFALADAATALLDSLSPATRQKIQQNQFVRVNAVICGREIKSLEDIK